MTLTFAAAARQYKLPQLTRELSAYGATVAYVRTRNEDDGTFGPWRLEVTIADTQDRTGLDTLVEAHNPANARKTRALGNIVSDVEAWIGTDVQRLRKIAALAAVLGAAGAGQLDRLQALTSIDPTEPDV